MQRNLLDYGLKESYNFKEIHVQTSRELSDVYHYPNCRYAKKILPENII